MIEALIHCQTGPDPYPVIHIKHHLTYCSPKQEVALLRVVSIPCCSYKPLGPSLFISFIFHTASLNFLCPTVWTLRFVIHPCFSTSFTILYFLTFSFPLFFFLKICFCSLSPFCRSYAPSLLFGQGKSEPKCSSCVSGVINRLPMLMYVLR